MTGPTPVPYIISLHSPYLSARQAIAAGQTVSVEASQSEAAELGHAHLTQLLDPLIAQAQLSGRAV